MKMPWARIQSRVWPLATSDHSMRRVESVTVTLDKGELMDAQPTPRFMTVSEVAEVMRVSKMTVYRLIHAGELPAIRVGKSFRVPHGAVTELIDTSWSSDDQAASNS